MDKPVIVVGAGLAGLHAACILAYRGVKTVVIEKNDIVGGYCSAYVASGYTFDIGATMLQTPSVLTDALSALGRDIWEYISLQPLNPIYRVCFADGSSLDLTTSIEENERNIRQISRMEATGYLRYMSDMEKLKKAFKNFFIERENHRLADYLSSSSLLLLRHFNPMRNVNELMKKYFHDPKLRAAFSFQSLYFGTPPNKCPAIFGMVPYFEITQGVWHPNGGLNSISQALSRIFEEDGGRLMLGASVSKIKVSNGRVSGVQLDNGEFLECERVISNANVIYTYLTLIDQSLIPNHYRWRLGKYKLSCSAIIALLGAPRQDINLSHHTFVIPTEPDRAYRDIFDRSQMHSELAAYLCCPTVTDPTMAPAGYAALYVLIPAPGRLRDIGWDEKREAVTEFILSELERRGLALLRNKLNFLKVLLPSDYERTYNQPNGMGFGIQPSLWQMGPFRPKISSPYISGLYFAGASTNPGCGIPLVLSSGRIAAHAVLADLKIEGVKSA